MKRILFLLLVILMVTASAHAAPISRRVPGLKSDIPYAIVRPLIIYGFVDVQPIQAPVCYEITRSLAEYKDWEWWQTGLMVLGIGAAKEAIDEWSGRGWNWDDIAYGLTGWGCYYAFRIEF
jgi:hypothetical protein